MKSKNNYKINYSFLFLIAFSLISGTMKDVLIFFISLLIHETGHILFALIFRVKIRKLNVSSYGITSKLEMDDLKIIPKLLIYLSGILFNALFILIIENLNVLSEYKEMIILCNKVLIVFNLLCIYPLDGYNVLYSVLAYFTLEKYSNKAFKLSITISLFLLIITFVIAIYYKSLALIIIVLVLGYKNIIKIKRRDEEILLRIISLLT